MRRRALLISVVAWLPIVFPSVPPASAQARPGSPCAPGGPAANGQYPPRACGLAIGRNRARPGERLTVTGAGFRPHSTVALEFRSVPVSLGSVDAGADGAFSTSVVIPAGATRGVHTIVATGTGASGQALELTSTVTVLASNTRVLGERVVRGASTRSWAPVLAGGVGGIALVGLGSVALLRGRRRRTA